ncbi:MAG: hypothetical protein WC799_20085 [Desulfobacteraceae bacterium]
MIDIDRIQELKNITMSFGGNIHSDQADEMSYETENKEKETLYVICLKKILPILNWKNPDFGSMKCM